MPILRAEIFQGRSPEVKKALAEALTQAMVQHLGCSPQGVTVIFDEFDKGNWFIGSKDANELFPNAK